MHRVSCSGVTGGDTTPVSPITRKYIQSDAFVLQLMLGEADVLRYRPRLGLGLNMVRLGLGEGGPAFIADFCRQGESGRGGGCRGRGE